jgi:hypothetical protein
MDDEKYLEEVIELPEYDCVLIAQRGLGKVLDCRP